MLLVAIPFCDFAVIAKINDDDDESRDPSYLLYLYAWLGLSELWGVRVRYLISGLEKKHCLTILII